MIILTVDFTNRRERSVCARDFVNKFFRCKCLLEYSRNECVGEYLEKPTTTFDWLPGIFCV